MTKFMGEYRAPAIVAAWLDDPAVRSQVEAELTAVALDNMGDATNQTRTIDYMHHVDAGKVTPVITWVNHE
jgi:hypothetical protein